jgi:hypothetical protein
MSAAKKSVRPKKLPSNAAIPAAPADSAGSRRRTLLAPITAVAGWIRGLRSESPHRSFRRTYRRDYVRPLELPGYVAFGVEVWRTLWRYKITFGLLTATYAITGGALVGLASQSTYTQLGELLRTTGGDVFSGNFGRLGEAGLLLIAGLSGGLNPNISETQQLLAGLLVVMVWLTTVWLLRAFLAGHKPNLRDGFYNAGAPIIPTILVSLFLVIQLIPAALVPIGLYAALATDPQLLSGGVEAMLFWAVASLLLLLSLYWITSTLIALVIVTLPGMYPLKAVKTAGDLVRGRRSRILRRIAWLLVITALIFSIVMVYVIMFDAWLKGLLPALEWLPLVPVTLAIVSSSTVVWMASYVYLLYRKVVDNDAASA